ncbi:tetratricopeptide repeat protein [Pontibacter sp. H249]|uniref:tetratricopeptide repeat protein n=1 Tax=Pontibacter sp. H249 TaxID=3133420 RepID=UPI0030BB100B
MRRLLFTLAVVLFATATSFAQEQQADQSHLVLPMFGNKPKTEAQQKKDEKFLTSCDKSFLNRDEASKFFMERGWEYYAEGQIDTAMYRFNLAWLLNPSNKDTYWAFGLITSSKSNNKEAISYFEKARTLDPKNAMLLSDMASSYLGVYRESKKKKDLKKATALLDESIAVEPQNAYALYNYSLVKFHQKKYADAWDYLHKSRTLDLSVIDYSFISQIVEKMPDPQGFFRSSDATAEQK